ncbi:hypothetical protein [Trabulsiella odontotermitis]|uniref:hypothetical protein n=1 Tax=Trabulsiella odontotermitis TaxID=379893 RepID=UPI000675D4C8|nr:hypothetical protein [Trabulsiella odontotermitis]
MDERYELADENGMTHEFIDWFFDEKKASCGSLWFMMMAAMWEGWKGREENSMMPAHFHAEPPVLISLCIINR